MVSIYLIENKERLPDHKSQQLLLDLPPRMQEQAMKYRRWQDFQAYLLGRYLLKKALEPLKFEADLIHTMSYTPFNRPYLPIDVDFNISHSGHYVACAISKGPRIGIDIEEIRPIDFKDFEEIFNDSEWSTIRSAPDVTKEFFRWWTMKEAVIKANGKGMSLSLKDVFTEEMQRGTKWNLYPIEMDDNHICHLAVDSVLSKEAIKIIQCENIE